MVLPILYRTHFNISGANCNNGNPKNNSNTNIGTPTIPKILNVPNISNINANILIPKKVAVTE